MHWKIAALLSLAVASACGSEESGSPGGGGAANGGTGGTSDAGIDAAGTGGLDASTGGASGGSAGTDSGLDGGEPDAGPLKQWVAYISQEKSSDRALFLADPLGVSAPSQFVAPAKPYVRDFAWSPDGARMAISVAADQFSNSELQVVEVNDSGFGTAVKVSGTALQVGLFEWSPDASKLVFVAANTLNGNDLFVTDLSGSQPGPAHQLNPAPASDEGGFLYFNWSPDGQWIAFAGDRGKSFFYHSYVANVGSLPPAPAVTISPAIVAVQNSPSDYIGSTGEPMWSNDSTRIAFTANATVANRSDLYLSTITNGTPTAGSPIFVPDATGQKGVGRYVWSHDGSRLGFTQYNLALPQTMELYVLPFSGESPLTPQSVISGSFGGGNDYLWDWSPVSRKIAVMLDGATPDFFEMFLVDANTWPPSPALSVSGLQNDDDVTSRPVWSPDGKYLYFGTNDPYPKGGVTVEVTATGANAPAPACINPSEARIAPDSKWMATSAYDYVCWSGVPATGSPTIANGMGFVQNSVGDVVFSGDSKQLALAGNSDGSGFRVFTVTPGAQTGTPVTPTGTAILHTLRWRR